MSNVLKSIPYIRPLLTKVRNRWREWRAPHDFSHLDTKSSEILKQVYENGYAVLENYFPRELCLTAQNDLDVFIETHPEWVHAREDKRLFGAENTSLAVRQFYEDPWLQRLSDEYYGEKSAVGVCMANVIEHRPEIKHGSGGDWHRDREIRQFKAMVYLSDVGENDGGFQFVAKSHMTNQENVWADMKLAGQKEYSHRMNNTEVERILAKAPERSKIFRAKAGTVLFIDTSGIHRGSPLGIGGKRYAVFNYYYPLHEANPEKMALKFKPLIRNDFTNKNSQ